MTDKKKGAEEKDSLRSALDEAIGKALEDPRMRRVVLTMVGQGPDKMLEWMEFMCHLISNKVSLPEAQNAMHMGLGAMGTIERAIQKQVKTVMLGSMPMERPKKEDIN